MLIEARTLIAGKASGAVVRLSIPLSLWGGVDLRTGRIVDISHPQCGTVIAGCLLAMPGSRGSSSSSSALVELARAGKAPRAIITTRADPILTIGALVCDYLYKASVPIALVSDEILRSLESGSEARLCCEAYGTKLEIFRDPPDRCWQPRFSP